MQGIVGEYIKGPPQRMRIAAQYLLSPYILAGFCGIDDKTMLKGGKILNFDIIDIIFESIYVLKNA